GGVQKPQIGLKVPLVIRRDVRLVGRGVVERRNGHGRTPDFVYTLDVRLEITIWFGLAWFGLMTAKGAFCARGRRAWGSSRWLPPARLVRFNRNSGSEPTP